MSAANEDYYRGIQLVTTQRISDHELPSPNFYSYNTVPTTKAQITFQTRVGRL